MVPLAAIYIGSAFLQFVAAWKSLAFVLNRRLGKVWVLVFLALLLKGILSLGSALPNGGWDAPPVSASAVPIAEFFVSLLLAGGFLLTEEWFRYKERLEARLDLISEVDRSLIGVLEEEKILSRACEILSRREGYRLAWAGTTESDGSVRVLVSAGAATGFLSESAFRWDDTPEGRTPPGVAARTGQISVMDGKGPDPLPRALDRVARRYGLGSCISARIDPFGFPYRMLTVHAAEAKAFGPDETAAFSAMARRVGEALQSARRYETFSNAKASYDDLLRNLRDGVLLIRGGKIVRANPSASYILGYPDPDHLMDVDPASLLADAKTVPHLRDLLRGPGSKETRGEWEATVRRRDGTAFTGEIAVTWVPRENRKEAFVPARSGPLGLVILRDISQRTRILGDLRTERDFSTRILEISGALVLHLGTTGEILLFNRQCEETTGWVAGEVLGRRMAELLLREPVRVMHESAFEAALAGIVPPPLETGLITTSGEERMISWRYAPLFDDLAAVSSIVVTGIDVTERRLLEKQIIQMQKMEAVGTLAGGIAHDFNNILTGVLGNLDIANRCIPEDSPASGPVVESIRASERAVHLVRQLMDFSRRSPSEQRPVDLGKVAREVVALFSQTIDRRIEITSSVQEGLTLAVADPNQVHQVLMNLCINARDAILESLEAKGGVGVRPLTGYWVYIRAENVEVDEEYCRTFPYARKGRFVRLSIGDNGAGMDEATRHRVFEPFFTTKKMGRGTGLGLSTVYGIVKQHNGWINLDSHPGKGTTFCAFFPEAQGAVEEAAPAAPPGRPASGWETVLFVDDEGLIRDLGRMVLESYGYTVLLAGDGREAVARYAAAMDRIHLVVLDLTMPHRSGLEVLRDIREMNPEVKVILSSGNTPEEDIGRTAFLAKPYRADALARIVRNVLDETPPG